MWSITVPPLIDYLAQVPDFRQRRGKRHPVPAVLALACVAMLSGARSESAMADGAAQHGTEWRQRLGLTHPTGPSQATRSRLFQGLDGQHVAEQVGGGAQPVLACLPCPAPDQPAPPEGIALDGKTLRGSAKRGAAVGHLLSAVSHRLGMVLAQVAVSDTSNEITAAPAVRAQVVVTGRVVTVDAHLTQRGLAQQILDRGGDYLLVVKDNQPTLLDDLTVLFADPTTAVQAVEDVTLQRGRVEVRHLRASTALVGSSDWPGVQQVLCVDRTVLRTATGEVHQERASAVTSLPAEQVSPAALLAVWRGHWTMENTSPSVRDVPFDEDRSGVRAGPVPQVMAALRTTAIGVMRRRGEPNMAAACRRFAAQPHLALAAIGLTPRL
jgi:predicted transposase YbfD/YdcC